MDGQKIIVVQSLALPPRHALCRCCLSAGGQRGPSLPAVRGCVVQRRWCPGSLDRPSHHFCQLLGYRVDSDGTELEKLGSDVSLKDPVRRGLRLLKAHGVCAECVTVYLEHSGKRKYMSGASTEYSVLPRRVFPCCVVVARFVLKS